MLYIVLYIGRVRVMRKTHTLIQVASALMDDPSGRHWGYELTKSASVRSGALYPILRRMLDEGWLDDGWEEQSEITGKRPARRYYKLTTEGAEALGALLGEARQDLRFGAIVGGFA
jgi:PadR family transcriptional regulator PadR